MSKTKDYIKDYEEGKNVLAIDVYNTVFPAFQFSEENFNTTYTYVKRILESNIENIEKSEVLLKIALKAMVEDLFNGFWVKNLFAHLSQIRNDLPALSIMNMYALKNQSYEEFSPYMRFITKGDSVNLFDCSFEEQVQFFFS